MDFKINVMGWYCVNSSGSGWGTVEGYCEHDTELSPSIKCWEIPEQLSDWLLLKKGSATWS
jgi:hypothetical protein